MKIAFHLSDLSVKLNVYCRAQTEHSRLACIMPETKQLRSTAKQIICIDFSRKYFCLTAIAF